MRLAALTVAAACLFPQPHVLEAQELGRDAGPVELTANPITPENPIPARTLEVAPVYPPEAQAIGATGQVAVRLTLDRFGRVAEVRRTSSHPFILPSTPATAAQLAEAAEALLTATANAVRQWQYDSPAQPPVAFNVTVAFTPGAEPALVSQDGSPATARLRTAERPPAGEPLPPLDPAWAEGAVRVGGAIRPPVKTKHVSPVYPAAARDARVEGVVVLEARIGEDGGVTKVRVRRSIPELDRAALDAVEQWEFAPTLLNGQPIPVVMTVTINFSL